MIVTTVGRPVTEVPLFILKSVNSEYLLHLSRVEVSDVGNQVQVDIFYTPLLTFRSEGQMTTVELRLGKKLLVVFISPKRITYHVADPNKETE